MTVTAVSPTQQQTLDRLNEALAAFQKATTVAAKTPAPQKRMESTVLSTQFMAEQAAKEQALRAKTQAAPTEAVYVSRLNAPREDGTARPFLPYRQREFADLRAEILLGPDTHSATAQTISDQAIREAWNNPQLSLDDKLKAALTHNVSVNRIFDATHADSGLSPAQQQQEKQKFISDASQYIQSKGISLETWAPSVRPIVNREPPKNYADHRAQILLSAGDNAPTSLSSQNIRDLWHNGELSQNEKFQTLLIHGAGIADVVNALSAEGQDQAQLKRELQHQALDFSESAGIDTYTLTSLVQLP